MKIISAVIALGFLVASANGFQPFVGVASRGSSLARSATSMSTRMSADGEAVSRKDAVAAAFAVFGAAIATGSPAAFADEETAPSMAAAPTDWGMTKSYYVDAKKMVDHMRYCTNMDKGTPNMAEIATNCRKEMTDFVANYRRSSNISGKLSYSNLYTSISVLAGHYASYGPKFPVPEKRRKRLMQEFNDIERAIKRQR